MHTNSTRNCGSPPMQGSRAPHQVHNTPSSISLAPGSSLCFYVVRCSLLELQSDLRNSAPSILLPDVAQLVLNLLDLLLEIFVHAVLSLNGKNILVEAYLAAVLADKRLLEGLELGTHRSLLGLQGTDASLERRDLLVHIDGSPPAAPPRRLLIGYCREGLAGAEPGGFGLRDHGLQTPVVHVQGAHWFLLVVAWEPRGLLAEFRIVTLEFLLHPPLLGRQLLPGHFVDVRVRHSVLRQAQPRQRFSEPVAALLGAPAGHGALSEEVALLRAEALVDVDLDVLDPPLRNWLRSLRHRSGLQVQEGMDKGWLKPGGDASHEAIREQVLDDHHGRLAGRGEGAQCSGVPPRLSAVLEP
mmetsp:Transcript_131175/g.365617  ORF Transcript_131175/g.365617 Transcript_131175/m.365617 type:complete len:356 (+) Transcript_131175:181-1248(+)